MGQKKISPPDYDLRLRTEHTFHSRDWIGGEF